MTKNTNTMLTTAELHFYEKVPTLLAGLVDEIKELKEEVVELRKEIALTKENK